jgi:hypothetical protein
LKAGELKRRTPMVRSGFRPQQFGKVRAKSLPKAKTLKTKQRAVSPDEKRTWDRLAKEIGCIACMKDGHFNPHVSIHHVDGRTKPDCHKLVLPLCAPHHQHDDTDPAGRVGVHPYKARFERLYGTQEELMALCAELLQRSVNA